MTFLIPGVKLVVKTFPPKPFTLLSDAEPSENIPEYLLCSDITCDLSQVMQGFPDIDRQQVGGEAGV